MTYVGCISNCIFTDFFILQYTGEKMFKNETPVSKLSNAFSAFLKRKVSFSDCVTKKCCCSPLLIPSSTIVLTFKIRDFFFKSFFFESQFLSLFEKEKSQLKAVEKISQQFVSFVSEFFRFGEGQSAIISDKIELNQWAPLSLYIFTTLI